ncbi:MAG: hypothetical protein HYS13_02515 [Planctomycetia bacterium]|nr:hypothetical protein [Planctomycetia bacterium]
MSKRPSPDTLNQYALSRALGSKMRPVKAARFGNFALLETTAEALRATEVYAPATPTADFSYAEDRVVVKAFEDVRRGAAPDAILWNTTLARAFYQRCRELGLDAPDAFLGRRLLNVRKNRRRYEKHGIVIAPATVREPHASIVPQHAHVIEFALVRLRFRHGASIDEILVEPALGQQFEDLALEIAPQLSPQDLRLGALNIRKSRSLEPKDQGTLAKLDPAVIDQACSAPIRLSDTNVKRVPESPGLIELSEGDRFLYIARNDNLRPTIEQFRNGQAFAIMANNFWTPRLDAISVQYVVGDECGGVPMSKWERRLIYEREPVFNWPMHKAA